MQSINLVGLGICYNLVVLYRVVEKGKALTIYKRNPLLQQQVTEVCFR